MKQFTLSAGLALALSSSFASGAIKIASSFSVIEYTPEVVANQDFFSNGATFSNGGVPNLLSDTSVLLASNAETQSLRNYATNKNLRIIYTSAEVAYRLVANKKSNINTLADLKGKKIGTFPSTSAAYFVERMMSSAGIADGQYTVVTGNTCMTAPCGSGTLPQMLSAGTVDAIGMWEPTCELAIEALGSNAVVFQNRTTYREIFSLHSTTQHLSDPTARASIVSFLKAMNKAIPEFQAANASVISRAASTVGMSSTVLTAAWPVHNWTMGLPNDLLDVLVQEDAWVAQQDRRTAMTRTDLANLIDTSVLADVMAS